MTASAMLVLLTVFVYTKGKRFVFPHNNIENFEKQLERANKITEQTGGGILVITEGVFGMSGDLR